MLVGEIKHDNYSYDSVNYTVVMIIVIIIVVVVVSITCFKNGFFFKFYFLWRCKETNFLCVSNLLLSLTESNEAVNELEEVKIIKLQVGGELMFHKTLRFLIMTKIDA